jgi:hypothetical protein
VGRASNGNIQEAGAALAGSNRNLNEAGAEVRRRNVRPGVPQRRIAGALRPSCRNIGSSGGEGRNMASFLSPSSESVVGLKKLTDRP